eukprot:363881-Chlamydomonas_euryale.AAC.11
MRPVRVHATRACPCNPCVSKDLCVSMRPGAPWHLWRLVTVHCVRGCGCCEGCPPASPLGVFVGVLGFRVWVGGTLIPNPRCFHWSFRVKGLGRRDPDP